MYLLSYQQLYTHIYQDFRIIVTSFIPKRICNWRCCLTSISWVWSGEPETGVSCEVYIVHSSTLGPQFTVCSLDWSRRLDPETRDGVIVPDILWWVFSFIVVNCLDYTEWEIFLDVSLWLFLYFIKFWIPEIDISRKKQVFCIVPVGQIISLFFSKNSSENQRIFQKYRAWSSILGLFAVREIKEGMSSWPNR